MEIGTERDHIHFLVQSVQAYNPASIVQKIKRITARKIFELCTRRRVSPRGWA
ncbi:MAG: transposase [Spirochaetaceae bacterium]|nr:transposase [Spirochaetaceae bacterium]